MMSIYSRVCRIYTPHHSVHLRYHCISVHPPSLIEDGPRGRDRACLEIHLETGIEWTLRCTWRPGSSEFGDAHGGHDCANLQAVIERVWRYTWRPWSSEFGDALIGRDRVNSDDGLGGRDRLSLEMHSPAVTERVWRCTCRLWSSRIGEVLGGGRFGGMRDGTVLCVNSWLWHGEIQRDDLTWCY